MEEVRQEKQIFVIACPNSGCEKVIANLGIENIIYQADFVHQLDEIAVQNPKSKFLLLYNPADIALGYALQAEQDPKHFLSLWEDINRKLIIFSRKNRSNSILENASIFIQTPEALSKVFEKLSSDNSLTINEEHITSPLSSLEQLLARQLLSDYPHLEKLNEELEASCMPIGDFVYDNILDNKVLYQRYVEQKKQYDNLSNLVDEYFNKNQKLKEENELLQLQLHALQEELEKNFSKLQDNIKQLNQLNEEKDRQLVEAEKLKNNNLNEEEDRQLVEAEKLKKNNGFFTHWADKRRKKNYEKKQMELIKDSGEFDTSWYLKEYPDVAEAKMNPILHYLRFGYKEGRNPSKKFNTNAYLGNNPDVNQTGMNPLYHYIKFGKDEGRSPSGQF